MMEKTKGLLLQSYRYLGKKKIFQVFTPEHGLLTFFASNSSLTPFCLAEWVFRKTDKQIYSLKETSLLDPLSKLKEDYDTLMHAGKVAQALLKTQMQGKEATSLFDLSLIYLKNLEKNPKALSASFHLKLLMYEGLFSSEKDPLFTPEEWERVQTLANIKRIQELISLNEGPFAKIEQHFKEQFGIY